MKEMFVESDIVELPARRLSALIGRQAERQRITQAIHDGGVLFLEGVAGIGKTALLEEVGRIATAMGVECPPIIDFYDTGMHVHQALESIIANSLDPNHSTFAAYWKHRQLNPKEDHWDLFLSAYTTIAVLKKHIVLRFDTAERLEYERDGGDVQADCEVPDEDAPSWEWLLHRLGSLANTTVVIAARPTPHPSGEDGRPGLLAQKLIDTYGKNVLLRVNSFTLEETRAYFAATELGQAVAAEAPEMVEKIHLLADGRPIFVALAHDWLKRGMWEPHIYPANVADLRSWQQQAQAEADAGQRGAAWHHWYEMQRNFEMVLVGQIRRLVTPLDVAVRYMALCRKGCDAGLLALLMGISLDDAQGLTKQLLKLSFVKQPRDDRGLVFLHDEMYDLVERHVWLVDWPNYTQQARLDNIIIQWYDEQLAEKSEQYRKAPDWRTRFELRSEQQLLYAERLYYQFDADPREGYRQYTHLDDEAIGSRELEWDILLRNEALWFTTYRGWRVVPKGPTEYVDGRIVRSSRVDYDCRRRWTSRYIARLEMAKAIRVAEKLLNRPEEEGEPELYRGGLLVSLATAQAYVGGKLTEPALQNFEAGIAAIKKADMRARPENRNPWLAPYLLGRAYLYQGLALVNKLRLDEAVSANIEAARCFRELKQAARLAEALNNQAYVFLRQGKSHRAMALCQEALRIRQGVGDEQEIGLSLNTMGIILERMDRPPEAIDHSMRAKELFRATNNERGEILADINLGRSYRHRARTRAWGEEAEDFTEAKQHLEDAINLQSKLGASSDVFYRIEALNEMGCLHRDWGAILIGRPAMAEEAREKLNLAEHYLNEAFDLTREPDGNIILGQEILHIDRLEDLARVYYLRALLAVRPDVVTPGESNTACESADSPLELGYRAVLWTDWGTARDAVSPEAPISGINPLTCGTAAAALARMRELLDEAEEKTQRYYQQDEHARDELHLMLSKVHCQRARLALLFQDMAEAARHYCLAIAYAEAYSMDAPEVRRFISEAIGWLTQLEPAEVAARLDDMQSVLSDRGLQCIRLPKWVDSVVYSVLGVKWPTQRQEPTNG